MVHDKDNTHSILIEKLGLSSETYDANEIKLSPDKDNPLRRVNEVHARLKNFLYAHNSFNRDSLQGYLDLFSFAMNPPSDPLEKVDFIDGKLESMALQYSGGEQSICGMITALR